VTAPEVDASGFRALFEDALATVERARVDALGRDASLWLALAPSWSVPIAELAEFPAPDGVPAFVDQAVAAGVAERATSLGPDGNDVVTFWARASARTSLVDPHRQGEGDGLVARTAGTIAARVRDVPASAEVPGPLRRWAEMVTAADGLPDGRAVLRLVADAVEQGDTVGAAEVLAVGEALEPLVGPTMTSALLRARRQLNLIESQDLGNLDVRVVVNRFDKSILRTIRPSDVRQALGRDIGYMVANDFALMRSAIDRGVPIEEVKRKSALGRDIEMLDAGVAAALGLAR